MGELTLNNKMINVLIVEDDPTVMEIHSRFITSMEGFAIAGSSTNGRDALDIIGRRDIDLLILDIFMPELDGIATMHEIRERQENVDIIVVSASHESETFQEIMRSGAFDYIVKPFTYKRFKSALESYRQFREKLHSSERELSQEEIDSMMAHRHYARSRSQLPKGLSASKLQDIISLLKQEKHTLSAEEAATLTGVSRVTARRYLEYLVSTGQAVVEPLYREVGRPVNKYRLLI